MYAFFEEKEYEAPLNAEISMLGSIWAPGQVFENHIGIDSAMLADSKFWPAVGVKNAPLGAVLDDFSWAYIWRRLGGKRALPSFSTNLFLQVKRPEFLKRSRYKSVMPGQHYRFDIKDHQQLALGKLAKKIGKARGRVYYASPVFHTHEELYEATRNLKIVSKSNFAPIEHLDGHSRWIYNQPGSVGVAHSEPERIRDANFLDEVERLSRYRGDAIEFAAPRDALLEELAFLSRSMLASANESIESAISREYIQRIQDLRSLGDVGLIDFVKIVLYCSLFQLRWYVIQSED